MDDFRTILIRVDRRLTRAERERFLFLIEPHITRDEQNSGFLTALQSLLDQEKITPIDCSFLIDVFQRIGCAEAAKILIDYQNKTRVHSSESPKIARAIFIDNDLENVSLKKQNHDDSQSLRIETDSVLIRKSKMSIKKQKNIEILFEIIRKHWILTLFLLVLAVLVLIGVLIPSIGGSHSNVNICPNARWNTSGKTILGIYGVSGDQESQLNSPTDVTFDDQGYLYISDTNNHRIQRLHPSQPNKVTTIISGILSPRQIFFHSKTKMLFIAEFYGNRILRWDLSKNHTGQSLSGCQGCSGVFVSSDSQIFIVEQEQHRLLICPFDADHVDNCETYAGVKGIPGRSSIHLNGSTFVTVNDKMPYVIDWNNKRIIKFDSKNEPGQTIFYDPNRFPNYVVVDDHQTIYSTMGHRLEINESEYFILRISSNKKTDRITMTHSSREKDILKNPNGLTFDRSGNLYVADTGNHRIVRFDIICNKNQT